MAAVEFRVLGDVGVLLDGSPARLRPMERRLLAVLLAEQNRAVGTDELVERTWLGEPPRTARTALRVHVDRLRETMRSHDVARLVSVDRGYRLVVERNELDAERFGAAVVAAHSMVDPHLIARTLRAALEEWRGEPFPGLDLEGVEVHRATLLRRHGELLVMLAAAELSLGRHRELVADLTTWCLTKPYDEALASFLATALYFCGEQVAALDSCRSFRTRLVDDLGLDPSRDFANLETAILDQTLRSVGPPPLPSARRHRLRGRDRQLARLLHLAEHPPPGSGIVVVTGPSGVGKSAVLREVHESVAGSTLVRGERSTPMAAIADLEAKLGIVPSTDTLQSEGSVLKRAERLLSAAGSGLLRTLLVDDVALLDADEVALLRVLCSRRPQGLSVIVAARDLSTSEIPLLQDAEALHRSISVDLAPLTDTEAGDVARSLLQSDQASDAALVAAVVTRAGGDPVLLTALCRQVSAGGSIDAVPASVVEFVRRGLGALETHEALVMSCAALATETFLDLNLVSQATQVPFTLVVESAETGLARGLLLETNEGLVFRHAAYQAAVTESLGRSRSAALHGRIAEALIDQEASVAAQVARHLRAAGPGQHATAARWTAREAEDLLQAGAPLAAVAQLARARSLGATSGVPPGLLLEWGLLECEARARSGQLTPAIELAHHIAVDARRTGLPEVFGRAAVAATGPFMPIGEPRQHAADLTAEALSLLPADGTALRIALLEAWVRSRVLEEVSTPASAVDSVRAELQAAAAESTDSLTRGQAFRALYNLTWREPVGSAARSPLSAGLVNAVASRTGSPMLRLEALRMRACDALEGGDGPALARALATYRTYADELGSPLHQWWSCVLSATEAGLRGDPFGETRWLAETERWQDAISADTVLIAAVERSFADALRGSDFSVFSQHVSVGALGDLSDEPLLTLAVLAISGHAGERVAVVEVRNLWQSMRQGPYAAAASALAALAISSSDRSSEAMELTIELRDRLSACGGGLVYINGSGCLGPADAYVAALSRRVGDTASADRYGERAAQLVSDFARSWFGWSFA